MVRLSKNFTSAEFACPCCRAFKAEQDLLDKLEFLRKLQSAPLKISSAYRCPAHNAKVGGSPRSQHLLGRAVDIPVQASADAYELVRNAMLSGFAGIGVYKTFIHLDVRKVEPLAKPVLFWGA
jgi:uncharacterized protein YcbK (DUF882 family)